MTPSPTQSNLTTAIRRFLLDVLDPGVEVILGNDNRVPEPKGGSFVVMTPTRFDRLATNFDSSLDLKMTGSIAGSEMTITDVTPRSRGTVQVGMRIFGVGVADGTLVTALGTGTGGVGTYTIAPAQTIASETLSGGRQRLVQPAQASVQLDFHNAPQGTPAASDMAQTVATVLRDPAGVSMFANQSPNYGVSPLYADDPRELPFVNDQQQYEWRWVVSAEFQVNQQVDIAQEYADSVVVGLIEVDERYPP